MRTREPQDGPLLSRHPVITNVEAMILSLLILVCMRPIRGLSGPYPLPLPLAATVSIPLKRSRSQHTNFTRRDPPPLPLPPSLRPFCSSETRGESTTVSRHSSGQFAVVRICNKRHPGCVHALGSHKRAPFLFSSPSRIAKCLKVLRVHDGGRTLRASKNAMDAPEAKVAAERARATTKAT